MKQTCPQCKREYETVLQPKTEKLVQVKFPNAKPWEREQLLSGLCSDACWDKFLGPDDSR